MIKTISAVIALLAFTAQSFANDPVLWTCKHLDNNTFPMTIYAYSATSSCPPPPHFTPPWQMHSHNPSAPTESVMSKFSKPGQIMVIPPEPECIIHAVPPTQ